jgi:hypothetical protein
MSDFIEVISKSAPIAVLGIMTALFVSYLQIFISRKERKHRMEIELMREERLKMEIDLRNKRIEELQKQIAVLTEQFSATEKRLADDSREKELVRLLEALTRKEGQKG